MIRYTKQFVYVMTDKAVSRWEAEAEHLDMYLENCIQREVVLLLISDNTTD
ncbi:hypothetical protein MCI89_22410 [Muricomes sp. OA1]|uniref:hypothetical protein n=1 Tax=Faecalicatena contorta TaxID=39482 RepID=UPI001FBA5E6B|nr:hypothetical protein [Faecalicatena contorta]MCH1971808.1 hypothetical protein [Muricomes sp. OA1]MCH1975098.1 hypothetical protein [Muricomes sp. OA1]